MVLEIYGDQVSNAAFTQNFYYIMASLGVVVAVAALTMIDVGLARAQNMLFTAVQKLMVFVIGTGAYMILGFPLWNYQYYKATNVPNAFSSVYKDWWFGGSLMNSFQQNVDPSIAADLGNSQIFFVFVALYGGFICTLFHTMLSERIRNLPLFIISAIVGGIIYPILLWLTWGSASPLTNSGTHDFVGAYSAYIFAGVFGLVLTIALKPRIGKFSKSNEAPTWVPHDISLATIGVILLMLAAPMVAMGCGFFIPGEGFYGVSLVTSGLGEMYINVFVAFTVGGIGGAIATYLLGDPVPAVLGPLAGYVANTAAFDVFRPWQTAVVALLGVMVLTGVYIWENQREIDDGKVFPLSCAAIVGTFLVGLFARGRPTGGYFGADGEFAFQHAEISMVWQLIGIAVVVLVALVSALVLVSVLRLFTTLRVDGHDELNGINVARTRREDDDQMNSLGPR